MLPQAICASVLGSGTMKRSTGERPVRWPVRTTSEPLAASSPSPRRMASSTSWAALISVYTALLACVMWFPVGQRPSPPNFVALQKTHYRKKVAGLCQKSRLDAKSSVAGFGRPLAASAGEQLGDVGGVAQVALVAELAVDGDRAFFLLEQPLAVGLPETDQ